MQHQTALLLVAPVLANGDRASTDSWAAKVVQLELQGQALRRLQALEQLTALRKVSLADNELTGVQGLTACAALEHLSLKVSSTATLPANYSARTAFTCVSVSTHIYSGNVKCCQR